MGTVHFSPSGALQFAVMIGAVEIAQARGRLKLMNGWSKKLLSTWPLASPPIADVVHEQTNDPRTRRHERDRGRSSPH
jgi:hypothetical protein